MHAEKATSLKKGNNAIKQVAASPSSPGHCSGRWTGMQLSKGRPPQHVLACYFIAAEAGRRAAAGGPPVQLSEFPGTAYAGPPTQKMRAPQECMAGVPVLGSEQTS